MKRPDYDGEDYSPPSNNEELMDAVRALPAGECPYCRSDDNYDEEPTYIIDGSMPGSRILVVRMDCRTCTAQWEQRYSLLSAELLRGPDKSVTNPAAHARDMNDALEKADAKARPWFTLAQFKGDDDGQPE